MLAATALAGGLLLGAACGDDEPGETTVSAEATPDANPVAEGPSIYDVANPADKGSTPPAAAARPIYEVANPADKGSRSADGETRPISGPF